MGRTGGRRTHCDSPPQGLQQTCTSKRLSGRKNAREEIAKKCTNNGNFRRKTQWFYPGIQTCIDNISRWASEMTQNTSPATLLNAGAVRCLPRSKLLRIMAGRAVPVSISTLFHVTRSCWRRWHDDMGPTLVCVRGIFDRFPLR